MLTLLGCAAAQQLFARAVAISPTDRSVPLEEAEEQLTAFAHALGVEPTRAALASLDQDGLSETAALTMMPGSGHAIVFAPVSGDALLPLPVSEATATTGLDKPLLIGSTADEFDSPRLEREPGAAPARPTCCSAARCCRRRGTVPQDRRRPGSTPSTGSRPRPAARRTASTCRSSSTTSTPRRPPASWARTRPRRSPR